MEISTSNNWAYSITILNAALKILSNEYLEASTYCECYLFSSEQLMHMHWVNIKAINYWLEIQ